MSNNDIEAVKQRVDIVDVVGESVHLQKAGKAFKGLCPFHSEKTPSFQVDPERQRWHCFGACSTGGDVFQFVMKRDSVDFVDALRLLAARAGVTLQSGGRNASAEHERLFAANEAAIVYFQQALLSSTVGREAREYVARRGLDAATIEAFEIGFAPDGWENLAAHLRGKGFADPELLEAGLLTKGEQGGVYDRFRRRLMFPIRDERGRAVGFGGRALDDAKPKYLNTPQTPLFDKSGLLYAMNRAKDAMRKADEAVLVEGYMDALAAHQFGYDNVVATLGTALTERHIQLLRRLARRVTLAMDADAAGLDAAVRGEEVARHTPDGGEHSEAVVAWDGLVRAQMRAPVEVRIFTVPSGKDPDEAIRAAPEEWPAWVSAAVPPFEFRLRLEIERTDMASPRGRVELADRMLPLLLQVSDPALQAFYVHRLASIAAVPETALTARLQANAPPQALGRRVTLRERTTRRPVAQIEPPRVSGEQRIEAFALALLLRFPSLREAGEALDLSLFRETAHQQVFEVWKRDPAAVPSALSDPLLPVYEAVMALRLPPYDHAAAESALLNVAQKLQLGMLGDQKRLLNAEVAELQETVNQSSAVGFMMQTARESGAPDLAGDPPSEPMLTLASHLRDDEYLMRQMHAIETDLRLRRSPEGEPHADVARQ